MSIPKVIHLCWFGRGEFPQLAIKCIDSWKQMLPTYTIRLWNEDSFSVDSVPYTKEAYANHKWAFVSDYVRLYALYHYGGVYMDTDLEVVKDFSPLLQGKKYVSSYIEGGLITAGFIASESKHPFIRNLLQYYEERHFIGKDGSLDIAMNPLIFTATAMKLYGFDMTKRSFENQFICIYPLETFMPYRKTILNNTMNHSNYHITANTYAIHHDMGSWASPNPIKKTVKGIARLLMPEAVYLLIKRKRNAAIIEQQKTNQVVEERMDGSTNQ